MCYHFSDSDTDDYIAWYVEKHNIKSYTWKGGRYYINGFDHGRNYAACQGQPDEIKLLEWGLIPYWTKTAADVKQRQIQTLNAKSETVFELPSFRHCIKKQKCLIFAKGFFEWRQINSKLKIPYLIGVRDNVTHDTFTPFTFGGIYDTWTDTTTREVRETFSIITTPANGMMQLIHNSKQRMPLIIEEHNQDAWLTATDETTIKALMQPLPENLIMAHPVSKLVTNRGAEKNVHEILEGAEYPEVDFTEFL